MCSAGHGVWNSWRGECVGVVIHGCGGGEWEDDMMRAENNFKLNS
jgi:hypothetical protein